MKRLLLLVAAASLLLPTLSLAQPGGRPDQGNRPDRPGGNERPGGPNRPNPGKPDRPGPGKPDRPNPGKPDRPGKPNRPHPGKPDRPNPGIRPPQHRPPAMRPPQRPRPQFTWRGRHYNPILGALFRYPPGYGYRRWTVGSFLPSLFLSSTYYYDDWRTLGIDPPPPGRRWVRYGPDLLLINQRTRRVEDVIYNAFY